MTTRTKLITGLLVACTVIFVFLGVSGIRTAFATTPTPQELAAAELPEVLNDIRSTQEAADKNAAAKTRQQQILDCLNRGACDAFQPGERQP